MENPSSKQNAVAPKRALSIQRTVIPLEYDNSISGFNKWTAYVRNELHVNLKEPFDAYETIANVKKILTYHRPPNVRRN